jgi:Zinc finger, C3HC4 type (RING finger)
MCAQWLLAALLWLVYALFSLLIAPQHCVYVRYHTTTCCIAQIRDPDDVKWAVDDVLSVTSSSSSGSSTTDAISTDVDSLFDPTWHECALCSEDNTSLMRDVLGCGHAFHGACLFKWWECGERQCPICRFKIQKK